jgi:polyphosphate glucokinase
MFVGFSAQGVSAMGPRTLAVDIGGSHIKVLVLDEAGDPLTERDAEPTPRPAVPAAVLDTIAQLAARQPAFERVSVGFPGVVQKGVTRTAPNLHPSWRDFPFEAELARRLDHLVRVANDADVQGFGAISGDGLEMVITLGTGMGSALFVDGVLVPNLELAHHPFADGKTYEQWLGNASLEEIGVEAWKQRLEQAIGLMRQTFNFDVLYLGGGNARLLDPSEMPADVRLVENIAGLLGGIALWTGLHGTNLVRAPHAVGAHCVLQQNLPF